MEDGIPEPARIRFPYLSDDHIQAMGRYVVPLRPVDDEEEGGEAA